MKNVLKNLGIFLLMFVLLTLMILAVSSATASAQKSTILIGDKTTTEVKKSVEVISGQLDALKIQIKDLEKEGDKKIAKLEKSKKQMLRNPGLNQFLITKTDAQIQKSEARTDSLIAVCERKKSQLENDLINFTVIAAGKDKQNIINLKSRNLSKMTDAMYALNYMAKKNSSSTDIIASTDSVFIDNGWYKKVFVTVSGLNGRFQKSFPLDGRSTATIPIPGPGNYVVYYDFGNETKCVSKRFDGHNFDFNPKTKKQYAFISGLPAL